MIDNMKKVLFVVIYFSFYSPLVNGEGQQPTEQAITLESPDKRIQVRILSTNNSLNYQVSFNSQPVVKDSTLGIKLESGLFKHTTLINIEHVSVNESWKPLWGQFSDISDIYNGVTLNLIDKNEKNKQLAIHFRLHDQGLAIQYDIDLNSPNADALIVGKTQFNFVNSYGVNSYGGEKAPIISKKIIAGKKLKIPVRLTPVKGPHIALHEAALIDGSPMYLQGSKTYLNGFEIVKNGAEYFIGKHKTAWRVMFIADKPGEFLTNTLLVNLAPALKVEKLC